MPKPTISIVTVVYNGEKLLEKTILSIVNQSYKNIEYLVVNGASTDGTQQLMQTYSHKISYQVSEPDAGIYHAMNKALRAATGDFVWFINAGDQIYSPDTLAQIFDNEKALADIYYGEAVVINQNDEVLGYRKHRPPAALHARSLRRGMVVSHQAFIVRRSLAPLYDLQYRICADVDWVINCLNATKNVRNTNAVLAKFLEAGVSQKKYRLAWQERYNVLKKHYGVAANLYNHFFIALNYLAKKRF